MKVCGTFIFVGFIAVLLSACGPAAPPEADPTASPPLVFPTASELKAAGQELFDAWAEAVAERDGAALYAVLAPDVTNGCTQEQVERSLMGGLDPHFPAMEVVAAFIDLEDPDRAMLQLLRRDEADSSQTGLAAQTPVPVPFPMVRDDGRWRLSFPYFVSGAGCPFEGESSQSTAVAATPTPRAIFTGMPSLLGPDFAGLAAPPGETSLGSGWGGGDGQAEAQILLETDVVPAELLHYYREQLAQPGWSLGEARTDKETAWQPWSYRDDEDRLWVGLLMAGKAGEKLQRVRLWVATSTGVEVGTSFRGGSDIRAPVPAATPGR